MNVGDKSAIQWCDATWLRDALLFAKDQSVYQRVLRRQPLLAQPRINVAGTLRCVTPTARWYDVARDRAAALADGHNVVPGSRWCWAVGAPTTEILQDDLLSIWRNRRDTTLSRPRVLPTFRAVIAIGFIAAPCLGVGADSADALPRDHGDWQPRTAAAAPSLTNKPPHSALPDRRTRQSPPVTAGRAYRSQSISARPIGDIGSARKPLSALVAPLLPCDDMRPVFLSRAPSLPRRQFHRTSRCLRHLVLSVH